MMENRKPNRLIHEKSPYLLQHAYNPVDWYAWGDDAFEKARKEDKPIFLSIGYSTCYWCHVMEREDFENEQIAEVMNKYFVSIKVDREERPDVDRVYMSALQSMTGSGGWPMSMFLTPDLKPFFGATYLPPRSKYGRAGFEDLLLEINDSWKTRRLEILKAADQVTSFLKANVAGPGTPSEIPGKERLDKGFAEFMSSYDQDYGGFGGAPKFPRPSGLNFLLRYYYRSNGEQALNIVTNTLTAMAKGGVCDHLGGGFHRYSVDRFWRVPHFEKMLYDQAQLAVSYIEAYQVTANEFFANIAKNVLQYVLRNLTSKEGGFHSAEDAESALDPSRPEEKEEGASYVWEKEEIERLLDDARLRRAEIFCDYFDIGERGNIPAGSDPHNVFTDKNILYVSKSLSETANKFGISTDEVNSIIDDSKQILFGAREDRPHPHLDDKILVSWNSLMISAFAKAYQVFNERSYLDAAINCTEFILSKLYNPQTHLLLHRYREGEARFEGTLEDYAFFIQALLDLYESSFDEKYLKIASEIAASMIGNFYDNENGGFFDVSSNDKSIIVRTKEFYDSAEPSGNSIAVMNLLRLAQFLDKNDFREKAERTLSAFSSIISSRPEAVPQMLCSLDYYLYTPKEIIIAGKRGDSNADSMVREVHGKFLPSKVLIFAESGRKSVIPYLSSIVNQNKGTAMAYVCENYACKLPTGDRSQLAMLLEEK